MVSPFQAKPFALSCPGNLLLCGEYAVLESGGMGICLAPNLRAWLIAVPCQDQPAPHRHYLLDAEKILGLRFFTRQDPRTQAALEWQGSIRLDTLEVLSTPGHPGHHPILRAVLAVLAKDLPRPGTAACQTWTLMLDSSEFHSPQGTKLGLGSSAAACLLAGTALDLILGAAEGCALASPGPLGEERFARQGVEIHRLFQGGKGSGYDVWTSFLGGLSRFEGGQVPQASALPSQAGLLPPFGLLQGAAPQKTTSAITLYRDFKDRNPQAVRSYLDGCRRRAQAASSAQDWPELRAILEEARQEGIALGSALGCPAEFTPPKDFETDLKTSLLKATGAGSENAVHFDPALEGKPGALQAAPGLLLHNLQSGTAQAKLTLFGEHAVLQGYPACGLGLDEAFTLCAADISGLVAAPPPSAPASAPAGSGWDIQALGKELQDLWPRLCSTDILRPPCNPGKVFAWSTVPRLGGYGSSAALSLAFVRLFGGHEGSQAEGEWILANRLDSIFHGGASGMDTGLALAPGLWLLHPRETESLQAGEPRLTRSPGRQDLGLWVVHAALPRQGNTKTLVARLRQELAQATPRGEEVRRAMASLGSVCRKALEILSPSPKPLPPDWAEQLGKLASLAHQELGVMGLAAPEVYKLLDLAAPQGSLGGKMSGAGGGGAFFCLCPDQASAHKIQEIWKNELASVPGAAGPGLVRI